MTTTSSSVTQSDTSLWLHNKLGTSNDSWTGSGGSIVSQLNPDILVKIRRCFQDLQPQVKLKLLLSLFHIPRRSLESWRRELESILEVAKEDSEPWVAMVAEMMKEYAANGTLTSDIIVPDSNKKLFNDLITELRKVLKKSDFHKDFSVLPLECHYLNKNAFISVVGHQAQMTKHFSLKRKPKAAALKAELMNKSQEALTKMRSGSSGSFPIRKSTMPRKMSDMSSSKLFSNRPSLNGSFKQRQHSLMNNRSVSHANKSEGRVKFLDITEQPIGLTAAARKRKKQQEIEAEQAAKKAALASNANINNNESSETPNAPKDNNNSTSGSGTTVKEASKGNAVKATPDYAAGLPTVTANETSSNYNIGHQAPSRSSITAPPSKTVTSTTSASTTTPSSLLAAITTPVAPSNLGTTSQASLLRNPVPAALSSLEPLPPQSVLRPTTVVTPNNLASNSVQHQVQQRVVQLPTQPIPADQARIAVTSANVMRTVRPEAAFMGSVVQQRPAVINTNSMQQPRVINDQSVRPLLSTLTPHPPSVLHQQDSQRLATVQQQRLTLQQQVRPQQQQTFVSQTQPQQQQQQTAVKTLTLTREQMIAAQEMFRTANRVTRPEKALILGFMAGSRENPCPHLGSTVTIKLSENQQNVQQVDGTYLTMIVESHFQMNYSSGEWKEIKKFRKMDDT